MNEIFLPREDDELAGTILAAIDEAARTMGGRAPQMILRHDPAACLMLLECSARIGVAAREISESVRAATTHIPWDSLTRLGAADVTADKELKALHDLLLEGVERLRTTLSEIREAGTETDQACRSADEDHALDRLAHDFYRPAGRDLLQRSHEFYEWVRASRRTGFWQYTRTTDKAPGRTAMMADESGQVAHGINLSSQDYLSLSSHPAIREAAAQALSEYGPHSPGSPMAAGNTPLSRGLEHALGELLRNEHITLFPTGWAAGYGAVVSLVRQEDHVVIDRLAHASLQQGARAATRNVHRFEHLSLPAVAARLRSIRSVDTRNGILVATDALFSADANSPDLEGLQDVCRMFDATLLVDVAHDLGAIGPGGTGVLGIQDMLGRVDLVTGSFSKTFASQGGFVASASPAVKQYVKMFGGTHLFSTAMSPVQAAVALEATRVIRSPEGHQRRLSLDSTYRALREGLSIRGLTCMGSPSPIVPLLIGSERLARVTNRLLFQQGVLAFLVEFPVAPVGSACFRLQVQAAHRPKDAHKAAWTIERAVAEARSHLARVPGGGNGDGGAGQAD
ncbi:aminotransferase class I/II-fold pyridoxal phosphate-dependent enzyme [Kitasatospora sp. NPDC048540]|uniref:aminotransferase class I/II-fold pyridoxal phosphate-dependent enzyme n=1 Tax=unclassified Kitasatospora TaxID=2633591 RepID=UPI00068E27A4|nr:aminotransferase class I/II-fold pyridoxal phosphate-dependent enzyme [Kitasatospora sp. MBT63]